MTINNTTRTAGPFIGNGVTTAFPFSYKVYSRDDLLVAQTVTATSVETIKVLDTDYTVTLSVDQNTSPGGVITMLVAPPVGTTLAATSDLDMTQTLDLTNQGGFYPTAINSALDRIVIMIQQLSARVGVGALNVGAAAAISTILNFITNLTASAGSSLIGFIQAGIGAVARTLESKVREQVSVFDFMTTAEITDVRSGAPVLNHTVAFQAFLDYLNTAQIETLEGSTYRTLTSPRGIIPFGRYNVTALTVYDSLDIIGDRAVIVGTNPALDIMTSSIMRWCSIHGVCFSGGRSHLNFGNSNYDATRIVVKECEFHGGTYYPIVSTVYGGVYTHLSATWLIEDSKFMHTYGFAINRCDYMIFNRCDLYPDKGNFIANIATIKNMASDGNCRLYIIDCTGVPTMGTHGVDRLANVRWIDHLGGDVVCTRFRVGGEGAGMPLIYFDAAPLTTGVPGPQISLADCELNGGPNAATDSGIVYLVSQVPQLLSIRNCKGPQTVVLVNDSSGGVVWATYFSAWETATGGLALKYYNYFKIDISMVAQLSPDLVTDRIPVQLDPLTRVKRTTIKNSALQSFPAATTAVILGGTPDFDNLGAWVVANPTRMTLVNRARRGYISGSIILDAGIAQGVIALRITNSSGVEIAGQTVRVDLAGGTGGALTEIHVAAPVYSAVDNDYFEMKIFCTSVGGCTAQAGKATLSFTQDDAIG